MENNIVEDIEQNNGIIPNLFILNELERISGLKGRQLIRYVERYLQKKKIVYKDAIRRYRDFYKEHNETMEKDLIQFYIGLYEALERRKVAIVYMEYRENKMYVKFKGNDQEFILLEHTPEVE